MDVCRSPSLGSGFDFPHASKKASGSQLAAPSVRALRWTGDMALICSTGIIAGLIKPKPRSRQGSLVVFGFQMLSRLYTNVLVGLIQPSSVHAMLRLCDLTLDATSRVLLAECPGLGPFFTPRLDSFSSINIKLKHCSNAVDVTW